MTKNNTNCPACHGCGWLKAFNTDTQKHEIQRCGLCEKFESEADVQEHLLRAAGSLPRKGLSSEEQARFRHNAKLGILVLLMAAIVYVLYGNLQDHLRRKKQAEEAIESARWAPPVKSYQQLKAEREYLELMGANMAQGMADPLSGRSAETELKRIQDNPEFQRKYNVDPFDPVFQQAFRVKHQEILDAYDRRSRLRY